MRHSRRLFSFGLLLLVIAAGVFCSLDFSGNSQDVTTDGYKVSGTIYDTDGKPAADALVMMRPDDYLPDAPGVSVLGKKNAGRASATCSTTTNRAGEFLFDAYVFVKPGLYVLEAVASDGKSRLLIPSIMIDSAFLASNTWMCIDTPRHEPVLKPPCSVTGTLHLDSNFSGGMVFIYGLESSAGISTDGTFIFTDLPSARLRFKIVVSTESGNTCSGDRIIETENVQTVFIDTLFTIICDGNGNDAGTLPARNGWYAIGETALIPENSGNFSRKGYAFTGWSLSAESDTAMFQPGDEILQPDTQIILYAQWTPVEPYELTLTASGTGTVSGSGTVPAGIPVTITATAARQSDFLGWKTVSGNPVFADSTAAATTVILENGDAAVEGMFRMITFEKTFGGIDRDAGSSLLQTNDGGYIIAGSTRSSGAGNEDVYLIKTNALGDTAWTRTFGGPRPDCGNSLQKTLDGGYVIAGSTGGPDIGSEGVYLVKTDADGNAVWTRTFREGPGTSGNSVQQTFDGGFIIAGRTVITSSAVSNYLIKTDTYGNELWESWVPGSGAVLQTSDGGYSIVGGTLVPLPNHPGPYDVCLTRTDAEGNELWTKTFGEDSSADYGNSLQQTSDGGFVIVGFTSSYGVGKNDIFLIKTDADGNALWTKTFGGTGDDMGNSIQQTSDGGYVITGKTDSFGAGKNDVYLIKTDADGNALWEKTFGGSGDDSGNSVQQASDGGYVITGETESSADGNYSVFLIKTDPDGNL